MSYRRGLTAVVAETYNRRRAELDNFSAEKAGEKIYEEIKKRISTGEVIETRDRTPITVYSIISAVGTVKRNLKKGAKYTQGQVAHPNLPEVNTSERENASPAKFAAFAAAEALIQNMLAGNQATMEQVRKILAVAA